MKDVDKIISASLHAREIIKKIMVFARELPARRASVNLNKIVEDGIYFFEARCAKMGIELVRNLSPGLPEFTGDPGQLNQVLVNLLVNAVQAMPEGGTLTVETRVEDGHALLIVEDTGEGMTEDVQKQIFIPFFTTKDVDEGTGLGLPVVHGIVASHKGSVNVKSRAGAGARFEIRLPMTEQVGVEESV
jgi:signal transduction histidine kinase